MSKKKILIAVSILAFAQTSFAADKAVFGTGTSKVEKYVFHVYDAWGNAKPRENEYPKARPRAEAAAKADARKAFIEHCKNVKNGEPGRVSVILAAAPGNSNACEVEWESDDEGTITCTAKALGTCTPKEKDPRIADGASAPARELVTSDGKRFLIDESGTAHPIAEGAR